MSGWVSTETAETALAAFDIALSLNRRMTPRVAAALRELHAAAVRSGEHLLAADVVPGHSGLAPCRVVAERLGVTERAVQRRAARGTIPAVKVGRQWLIDLEKLERAA